MSWFNEKGPQFDNSILAASGGTGKAFAALGQSLVNIDESSKAAKKEVDTKAYQEKVFNANRDDRKEDVKFKLDEQTKADAEKTASDGAKVKTMREYLTKQGIDTKDYNDNDMLYAGDMIEKTHTDKSDLKFSQFVYNNKTPYAVYKDKNDNMVTKPLFDTPAGSGKATSKIKDGGYGFNADGSAKTALQFGEEKTNERFKKKYGQSAQMPID
jgi:hypothetical protein